MTKASIFRQIHLKAISFKGIFCSYSNVKEKMRQEEKSGIIQVQSMFANPCVGGWEK